MPFQTTSEIPGWFSEGGVLYYMALQRSHDQLPYNLQKPVDNINPQLLPHLIESCSNLYYAIFPFISFIHKYLMSCYILLDE